MVSNLKRSTTEEGTQTKQETRVNKYGVIDYATLQEG